MCRGKEKEEDRPLCGVEINKYIPFIFAILILQNTQLDRFHRQSHFTKIYFLFFI
ncbi:hypothetical protein HMPREF1869_01700 [Bacteroidales bacterium KA00251]|nr:hypothetical protein HMPREF1869_01700 [Bacteroidales bacterium KA00251]